MTINFSCLAALLMLGVSVAPTARAAADDTAECIAVMQLRADDLARQVKAGDTAQEPALKTELVRAGALIGHAYLEGVHSEAEAKARLKDAQDLQAAKSAAELETLRQECSVRADAQLASASGPQRFIVQRFALARMQRMLEAH